jgi:hypothetical protein
MSFKDLIEGMVQADLKAAKKDLAKREVKIKKAA